MMDKSMKALTSNGKCVEQMYMIILLIAFYFTELVLICLLCDKPCIDSENLTVNRKNMFSTLMGLPFYLI